MNPYTELANIIQKESKKRLEMSVFGLMCTLGVITENGVKLDHFKNEIPDPLYAEWEVQVEIPPHSRMVQIIPTDGLISSYTARLDFQAGKGPSILTNVKYDLKSSLKPGDRVLCLPINNGQDVVIISKVVE
jgi:hypothetical protein